MVKGMFVKIVDRIRSKEDELAKETHENRENPSRMSLIKSDHEMGRMIPVGEAPAIVITSNVILSSQDSDRVRTEGQTAIDEIAARIQERIVREVKISMSKSYDTDAGNMNWGGPSM